ncbi:GIY-YIG nuclease family protein [Methylobacterium komagatae]
MSSFVYLIEAQNEMVKIGWSHSPVGRLDTLRTCSPVMVRLIACWVGAQADESLLHKQFRQQRHHNEWFSMTGDFASFVERKRGEGVARIPAWEELRWADCEAKAAAKSRNLSTKAKERWANPEFRWRCAMNMAFQKRWNALNRKQKRIGSPIVDGAFQALRDEVDAEFSARRAEFGCATSATEAA